MEMRRQIAKFKTARFEPIATAKTCHSPPQRRQRGTACDDGNACTVSDSGGSGLCTGTSKSSDDSNPCTADSCDPTSGCKHSNGDNGTTNANNGGNWFVVGGYGAKSWKDATTWPAAAGAGAVTVPGSGQGGNAGLVILTYYAATCPL